MSLTIELPEPDMIALAELAQSEGRDPAECASHIVQIHLNSSFAAPLVSASLMQPVYEQIARSSRPSARTIAGKYRHLNVSTETLRQHRQEDLEIENAKHASRSGNSGDSE